jgi:RNA polymerase sigma factor (sigma-70 family)
MAAISRALNSYSLRPAALLDNAVAPPQAATMAGNRRATASRWGTSQSDHAAPVADSVQRDTEAWNQLASQIRARDAGALQALYRATAGKVYGLALRIVITHETAEEVVADAFLQVWNTIDRFDAARGSLLAWLLVITRSRALDALRRQDTAMPVGDWTSFDTLGDDPWAALGDRGDAYSADPYRQQADAECAARLASALNRISAVERQLISLAFLRGLTHHEIAQHSHLPLGTVKTHIRRGLVALRRELEKEWVV